MLVMVQVPTKWGMRKIPVLVIKKKRRKKKKYANVCLHTVYSDAKK